MRDVIKINDSKQLSIKKIKIRVEDKIDSKDKTKV